MGTIDIIIRIAIVVAIILFVIILIKQVYDDRKEAIRSEEKRKQYEYSEAHTWHPKYNLSHEGVRVFNIPFEPDKREVFYLENEYDEAANEFVKDNIDEIRKALAKKGLTFTYLPYVHVSAREITNMMDYYCPGASANDDEEEIKDVDGLRSNFLLDYMVYPENRSIIKSSFAWYGYSQYVFGHKKRLYIFDYISFDGYEALENPREVLADMLPELGNGKTFIPGVHFEVRFLPESAADDKFNNEDALSDNDKQVLEKISTQLDTVRKRGISEAVIAKYVKKQRKLSRMNIKYDFTIVLNDYNDMEIRMEPLVKAVYILFLRHPEGITFKDLPDYKKELEVIYRCVKSKKNDIDRVMASPAPPKISKSVEDLCNPTMNSINEKCTRIKEAFVSQFHDTIASYYYVIGAKVTRKLVPLSRNLITWEGEKNEL